MPTKRLFGRQFDVRPDSVDYRDLAYQAPLVSLPDRYPSMALIDRYYPQYSDHEMVLDQGAEGGCTSFGLASLVNYLRWARTFAPDVMTGKRTLAKTKRPKRVSRRMLYENARLYDEGKDSSDCRSTIKGFHKNGLCTEDKWPFLEEDGSPGLRRGGWIEEAGLCPLAAYHRIISTIDMQSAIDEAHGIYVSAEVHSGWNLHSCEALEEATIHPERANEEVGGHAFAIVGYAVTGFIVLNSWGPDWGFHGFGVMPYKEWTEHGHDAWVLRLGAPMLGVSSPNTRSKWWQVAEPSGDSAAKPRPHAGTTRQSIFVSYRRGDSADVTGRIRDRLVRRFGKEAVFTDVMSIPLGVDFRRYLDRAVGQCKVLVAVVGPQWAVVSDPSKTPLDEGDYVRIEIEAALKRDIPVIPVLVGGTSMPSNAILPDAMSAFSYRNAAKVRPDPDFESDIARLIDGLDAHLSSR